MIRPAAAARPCFGMMMVGFVAVGHWWFAPGVLLSALLFFNVVELVACYWVTSANDPDVEYNWTRAIRKKMFTWMLWTSAVGMDIIVHLAPQLVPHAIKLPLLTNDAFLPFTISGTVMFLLAEFARIAQSAAKYQGKSTDALIVIKFLRLVRIVNQNRWSESGRVGNAPGRWTDGLTQAEAEEIVAYLRHRRSSPPPALIEASPQHRPPTPEEVEDGDDAAPQGEQPVA